MTSTVSELSVKHATEVAITHAGDKYTGSADQTSPSTSSLLSTLAPVALYAAVSFLVFLVLRKRFLSIYQPRTLLSSSKRTPTLSKGLTSWVREFFEIRDLHVLKHHSLDAYLFLRLLKMSVMTCLVGSLICIPILIPVNATGGGGQEQLNIITMSNVTNSHYRFFAHAGCAYLFFGFILYMVTRESIYYINLRQDYLLSPRYAHQLSSRTVLFTSVPEEYLNEAELRLMLGDKVKHVWFSSDVSSLKDQVYRRDMTAMKLEKAVMKRIKAANSARPKVNSGIVKAEMESDWCCIELKNLVDKVKDMQNKQRRLGPDIKRLNSVFVEFTTIEEAQAAYQSLVHHRVMHMAPRFIGISPKEIIWTNLRIKWCERTIRTLLTVSFVVALIIFWSVPVAFIGSISNITSLTTLLPFLGFILKVPATIRGVITGLLPSLLLSILMSMVPMILRITARLGGDISLSAVELTVQNTYFGFQIVQVFLVATLGSAASSAVGEIAKAPGDIPSLLAQSIPKASNFYLSYIILQGLGVASSLLLDLPRLASFIVLGKLFDKTPRQMKERQTSFPGLHWGTVFPVYTNLLIIAICYSCIAPLVLVFATIGFYFFYLAYRYNLLFVLDCQVDTRGRVYPRALQQVFVGLYVAEICLIGLFAIATGESIGALGPLILMVVFTMFTAIYHMCLNSTLDPLIKYNTRSLETLRRDQDKAAENGNRETNASLGHVWLQSPTLVRKFLLPNIFINHMTLNRFMSQGFEKHNESETEADAYLHPSITSEVPRLSIPRDLTGISQREVDRIGTDIPITQEDAYLDSKNKIVLNGVKER